MGEDVEQAQELSMDPSRSRHDAVDQSEGHLSKSVRLAVFVDLGTGHVFQSSLGIGIAQLAISANIRSVISTKIMDHSDVNDEVLVSVQDIPGRTPTHS